MAFFSNLRHGRVASERQSFSIPNTQLLTPHLNSWCVQGGFPGLLRALMALSGPVCPGPGASLHLIHDPDLVSSQPLQYRHCLWYLAGHRGGSLGLSWVGNGRAWQPGPIPRPARNGPSPSRRKHKALYCPENSGIRTFLSLLFWHVLVLF